MGLLDKLQESEFSTVDTEKYQDKRCKLPGNILLDGTLDVNSNCKSRPNIIEQTNKSRFGPKQPIGYLASLVEIPEIQEKPVLNTSPDPSAEVAPDLLYSTEDYMEDDYA